MNFSMFITVVEILIRFGLPILIFAGLFIGYMHFRAIFHKCLLDKRVLALLTIGAISTSIVNIPFFIGKDVMFTVNLGSVIIPLVISSFFIYKMRINIGFIFIMIIIISLITYLLSYIDPEIGIVSDFPWYILPIFLSAFLAILFLLPYPAEAVPLAYIISTFGVFIGADLTRLPVLFQNDLNIGYIGGLGIFDLIYISGLFALTLTLVCNYPRIKAEAPKQDIKNSNMNRHLHIAWNLVEEKRYTLAVKIAIKAIILRLADLTNQKVTIASSPRIIKACGLSKIHQSDFLLLLTYYKEENLTRIDAIRALVSVEQLCRAINMEEQKKFSPLKTRLAAFGIDCVIQCIIFGFLLIIMIVGLNFQYNELFIGIWRFALFWWAIFIHIFYFIFFEWYFGQTPGKLFVKIKVVALGPNKRIGKSQYHNHDFLSVFTRNILRIIDLIIFLLSIFSIIQSTKRQRLGDYFAQTAVIRI